MPRSHDLKVNTGNRISLSHYSTMLKEEKIEILEWTWQELLRYPFFAAETLRLLNDASFQRRSNKQKDFFLRPLLEKHFRFLKEGSFVGPIPIFFDEPAHRFNNDLLHFIIERGEEIKRQKERDQARMRLSQKAKKLFEDLYIKHLISDGRLLLLGQPEGWRDFILNRHIELITQHALLAGHLELLNDEFNAFFRRCLRDSILHHLSDAEELQLLEWQLFHRLYMGIEDPRIPKREPRTIIEDWILARRMQFSFVCAPGIAAPADISPKTLEQNLRTVFRPLFEAGPLLEKKIQARSSLTPGPGLSTAAFVATAALTFAYPASVFLWAGDAAALMATVYACCCRPASRYISPQEANQAFALIQKALEFSVRTKKEKPEKSVIVTRLSAQAIAAALRVEAPSLHKLMLLASDRREKVTRGHGDASETTMAPARLFAPAIKPEAEIAAKLDVEVAHIHELEGATNVYIFISEDIFREKYAQAGEALIRAALAYRQAAQEGEQGYKILKNKSGDTFYEIKTKAAGGEGSARILVPLWRVAEHGLIDCRAGVYLPHGFHTSDRIENYRIIDGRVVSAAGDTIGARL